MVRLALLDPSAAGDQPFWSEDGAVALVFNGEMYNFREERDRLEATGLVFRSGADTEVVLALYLEDPSSFVKHIRGMFALAVLDFRGGGGVPRLTLARDPFGMKPLYIVRRHGSVAFSSEVRALLKGGLVGTTLDSFAIADLLSFGFVVDPRTMLEGVSSVQPGAVIRHEPDGSSSTEIFSVDLASEASPSSRREASEVLRARLEEAVSLHAFADVPVGAFLSGGVDSIAIVSLLRSAGADLNTYTLRSTDLGGHDETLMASSVARALNLPHQVVDVTGADAAEVFDSFVRALDQPTNDGFNTWLLSAVASNGVKGILSGLGGDELFGGYAVVRRMQSLGSSPMKLPLALAGRVAQRSRSRIGQRLAARSSLLHLWAYSHQVFSSLEVGRALGLPPAALGASSLEARLDSWHEGWRTGSVLEVAELLDRTIYMGNQLLRDADVAGMNQSLEIRTPFVDRDLSRFVRSLPAEYKLPAAVASGTYESTNSKAILFEALADLLPPALLQKSKQGFSLPYQCWLDGPVGTRAPWPDVEAGLHRRGVIDTETLPRSMPAYPKRWTLTVLEMWCRENIDGRTDSSFRTLA